MDALLDTAERTETTEFEIHVFPTKEVDKQADIATQEHERLLQKFDFERAVRQVSSGQRRTVTPYPALEGYELHVIMAFLPSAYDRENWSYYGFDVVPLPALKALEAAADTAAFDEFELWTPERPARPKPVDPMIVGVIGDYRSRGGMFPPSVLRNRTRETWRYRDTYERGVSFHPITRWGEAVRPFSEIEKAVKATRPRLPIDKCCGERMVRPVKGELFCLHCGRTFTTQPRI